MGFVYMYYALEMTKRDMYTDPLTYVADVQTRKKMHTLLIISNA